MNRISAIALLAVAGFAATHSASAQSRIAQATVPFAFTVNGTTLPAGTYYVNSLSSKMMEIRSADTKHPNAVTVLTQEGVTRNRDGATKLVFAAYGSQYFLHEIVSSLRMVDAVIPTSQQEEKTRVEWASKSSGQPVLVALK